MILDPATKKALARYGLWWSPCEERDSLIRSDLGIAIVLMLNWGFILGVGAVTLLFTCAIIVVVPFWIDWLIGLVVPNFGLLEEIIPVRVRFIIGALLWVRMAWSVIGPVVRYRSPS
jgi:hypothetical protein